MRSAPAAILALAAVTTGCSNKTPEAPAPSEVRKAALAHANDLPGAQPLAPTDQIATDLKIGPELLDLLPYGPHTPVVPVYASYANNGEITETKLAGIAFSVGEDVAPLTVHLLRRECERADATKGFFAYQSAEPAGAGRVRIAVLAPDHASSYEALALLSGPNTAVDSDSIVELLDAWHDRSGIELFGVGPDWVAFDVPRPPVQGPELEELAQALAWIHVWDDPEAEEPDPALVARLAEKIRSSRHVRVRL